MDAKPKPGGKKIAGMPLWAWGVGLALALVVGIAMRRKAASGSSGGTVSDTGTGTVAPTDSGISSDTTSQLADEVSTLTQQVQGLSDVIASQPPSDVFLGPVDPATVTTSPIHTLRFKSGLVPNAPVAGEKPPPAKARPAASHPVRRAAAPYKGRYYTRKAQVPLKRGQSIHFRTGRGYYPA